MASAPLALAITAFDFTTGKITVPNHGQATGTGPCALMNVGGVLPRGAPGFAPVTDYFVINVDTNTLQLASSSTNAFSNTPITFTDNGTGVATLLIGVPYRRPRTHVATIFNGDGSVQTPGTQIFSADLNANYDAWSAAYALLTGQPQTLIDSPTFAGNLTVGGALLPFADFTFTAAGGGSAVLTASNHPLHTGAGPIRGSSSTTLPSGFPSATDVFAIKLSANTFSIATSQANALAGIAIPMSTAGTGTHTINHQPTTTRISDVTATRNLTVGGTIAGNHTTRTLIIGPAAIHPEAAGSGLTNFTWAAGSLSGTQGPGAFAFASIPLPSGKRITAIRCSLHDFLTGANAMTLSFVSVDGVGSVTTIASSSSSAGNGTDQTISITGLTTIIAAGNSYAARVATAANTGPVKIYKIEVDFDGSI